jgi:hypothetical protein
MSHYHVYIYITYIYTYIYTVYRNTIHIISIHRGFSYRGIQLTSKDGTSLLCRIRLPQVPNDVGSSNLKLEPLDLGNTRLHHPLMLDFGFYPLINNQHGLVILMVWKILENIDGNINNKKREYWWFGKCSTCLHGLPDPKPLSCHWAAVEFVQVPGDCGKNLTYTARSRTWPATSCNIQCWLNMIFHHVIYDHICYGLMENLVESVESLQK